MCNGRRKAVGALRLVLGCDRGGRYGRGSAQRPLIANTTCEIVHVLIML